MFVEGILEVGKPQLIMVLYNDYYNKLKNGKPCYLLDDKGNKVGRIYEISFEGTDKELKLIGKFEVWERNNYER